MTNEFLTAIHNCELNKNNDDTWVLSFGETGQKMYI